MLLQNDGGRRVGWELGRRNRRRSETSRDQSSRGANAAVDNVVFSQRNAIAVAGPGRAAEARRRRRRSTRHSVVVVRLPLGRLRRRRRRRDGPTETGARQYAIDRGPDNDIVRV